MQIDMTTIRIAVQGAVMSGEVPHHAGHIIGWKDVIIDYDEDGDPIWGQEPIYCSGHSVTGTIDTPCQSKFYIQGKPAALIGSTGPTTDPCDGSDFIVTNGSSKMYVCGTRVALDGSSCSINPGSGSITNPNQNKFYSR